MHPIITNSTLPAARLPTSELACTICPMATWFSTPIAMSAYCGKMYLVVWDSDKTMLITECSAQQDALLEQMQTEEPAQPVQVQRPSTTDLLASDGSFGLLAPEGTEINNPPSEATFL